MRKLRWKHLIEYDEHSKKIIITRLMERGTPHLFTELSIEKVRSSRRTAEDIGQMLGEALVLDMKGLRDRLRVTRFSREKPRPRAR